MNVGGPGAVVDLNTGVNTITIVVTAQDHVTSQTYTLLVTRAEAIGSIGINIGNLSFDPNVTEYSINVPNTSTAMEFTIGDTSGGSTVDYEVNGSGYLPVPQDGKISVSLGTGLNVIHIRITASDGVTMRVYTFTVTRASIIYYYLPIIGR